MAETGEPEFDARARHYNVDAYYREINRPPRDAYRSSGPRVGDRAPGFALPKVEGGVLDSAELVRLGPVALVFGCYSATPIYYEMPALDGLALRWAGRATVALVYTREIHPGEASLPFGKILSRLTSTSDKIARAREFRHDLALHLPVAVDDLAGTVHCAYGALPFSQVVIDRQGTVVHRSEWASAPLLEAVLENLEFRAREERFARARLAYSETLWCVPHLPDEPGPVPDEPGPPPGSPSQDGAAMGDA